jgi:hypothetical protein
MSLVHVTQTSPTSQVRFGLIYGFLIGALAIAVLPLQSGFADEQVKTEVTKLPPELDVVPRDALGFITVRVADLWGSDIAKQLRLRVAKEKVEELKALEDCGLSLPDIERFTAFQMITNREVLMLVTTTKPYILTKALTLIGSEADIKKDPEKNYYESRNRALHVLNDRTFILGTPKELKNAISIGKKPERTWPEPWRFATEKHHVVVGINGMLVKSYFQVMPLPVQGLLQSQSAALAIDFGVEFSADLQISFANANQVKEGEQATKAGSVWLQGILTNYLDKELEPEWEAEAPNFATLLRELANTLGNVAPKSKATSVQASLRVKLGAATASGLLAELSRFDEGTSTTWSGKDTPDPTREHLKQLAEALLNYGLDHGHLPANAIYSKKGEPLLSWRVELLPYLKQEQLYKRFKLDEPWDSEHNLKLIKDMPEVFNDRWHSSAGKYKATSFRVFSGKDTAFEGTKGARLDDFPDGVSTTFLIVQAKKPVPWTKPDLLPYFPNRRLCGLGGYTRDKGKGFYGFYAAFADGSVRFFKQETDEKTIRALITRNGGEKVKLPDER